MLPRQKFAPWGKSELDARTEILYKNLMKAFWWFKENAIAGMARPGFNGIHWWDLPFEETMVYSWLGQRTSDSQSIESLQDHIRNYGAKIIHFYKVDESSFKNICESFEDKAKLQEVFARVAEKTKSLGDYEIKDDRITFNLCSARLQWEIDFLKKQKIDSIVTLTEIHNQKAELKTHFDLHHLAIDDLSAPEYEQVIKLADLIKSSRMDNKRLAVHCMAGIGRTSTMLMAAHLVLGEDLESLLAVVQKQNPMFKMVGPQAEFIKAVAKRTQG